MTARTDGTGRKEEGFSLVDLVIVVAIIGILTSIAFPLYFFARHYAQASSMVSDFLLVRTAAVEYYGRKGSWPPELGRGREPPELASYLQKQITWRQSTFDYDWEYWVRNNGMPSFPSRGVRIGFSVRTNDAVLRWMLQRVWGGGPLSVQGNRVTFVIEP